MTRERFAVIPAAYVLLRRRTSGQREVLLQLRRGTGFMDEHWACGAAGHVEEGESVLAAAVREVREELGIEVDPADLIPLVTLHRRHSPAPIDQRVDFFFVLDEWQGEPRLQEGDKAADLQWFPLNALPEPVVPHEKLVLDGLRDGDLPQLMALGFDEET